MKKNMKVSAVISSVCALVLCQFPAHASECLTEPNDQLSLYKPAVMTSSSTPATSRKSTPLWGNQADYDALLMAIEGVQAHGLDPQHYDLNLLLAYRAMPTQRETYATNAWLKAAHDLENGHSNPKANPSISPDHYLQDLHQALATGRLSERLERLAPQTQSYQSLRSELLRVRRVRSGLTTQLGTKAFPSASEQRTTVLQVQDALIFAQHLTPNNRSGRMDAATQSALKALQLENGWPVTGIFSDTENLILQTELRSIEDTLIVNMERWRWLPRDLGRRHIRVNVPDYELYAIENGLIKRRHRVIAGKLHNPTPQFSDEIEYIVFNPWWRAPSRLSHSVLMPKIRANPTQMEAQGYKLIAPDGRMISPTKADWSIIGPISRSYRVHQAPGKANAMGQVKFIFPNTYSVYIHDTPDHSLFTSFPRPFSLGCIRVEDPVDLAEWVLGETPGWDRNLIDKALREEDNRKVNLAVTVPVHIQYFTALADGTRIRYADDVYSRDNALRAEMRIR